MASPSFHSMAEAPTPPTGFRRPYGVPMPPVRPRYKEPAAWSVATVLRILLEPSGVFNEAAYGVRWSSVAAFVVIHGATMAVVATIAASVGARSIAPVAWDADSVIHVIATAAAYAALAALVVLALSVIVAGAFHPLMRLCGGSGGFTATYTVVGYGTVPATVLFTCGFCMTELLPDTAGWDVWLSVAGVLWSCVAMAIGIIRLHSLDGIGAATAGSLPLILVVATFLWGQMLRSEAPEHGAAVGLISQVHRLTRVAWPGTEWRSGTPAGLRVRTKAAKSRDNHSPQIRPRMPRKK